MRSVRPLAGFFLFALAVLAAGGDARAQVAAGALACDVPQGDTSATGHLDWPRDNPVWSLDFVRPARHTTTDGAGLELRNVRYRGRMVLRRAHVPILNVEYDPGGGCSCFRDWSYSEALFRADGVHPTQPCYAEATPGVVRTTCEQNAEGGTGGDVGSFRGVAVEDYGTELVLTSHMQAGWYRYRMRWHFYADGRIWPEFSFSAASATCTSHTHRHHAYWRFDFDVDGAAGDEVREVVSGVETLLATETDRTWGNPASGTHWLVSDQATGAGYRIVPSSADLLLPADAFSQADALVMRYDPLEVDDGSPGCDIRYRPWLDGESIVGEDVVFWYRSSALHTSGNPWECDIVGPMLVPVQRGAGQARLDATLGADGAVRLSWTAPATADTAGFTVEHRLEGAGDWRAVGFVAARGASSPYVFETGRLRGGIHRFRLRQDGAAGAPTYSQEVELRVAVPGELVLEAAYPNPFDRTTTVRFKVDRAQPVTLALFDALGRRVAVLFDGYAEADRFETVTVDAAGLLGGAYVVRLQGQRVARTIRVVVLR